ncbi:YwmB family TATA-box binding protein [Bacillus subtilis]|uniref:YwmB family TATA-box binding protein n=1 Tax=Bacillus subtilis TaxID=1423 RepID=UPI00315DCF0A
MKKKQVSHAIIISVMLSFVIAVFHTIHANELTPLAKMAEGMERQDVSIDKWTLHAKQNMSLTEKEFYQKVQRLKSEYRQYDWVIAREDKMIKAIGTYTDKKNRTSFRLQLVTTLKKHNPTSYLLYEQMSLETPDSWNDTYEQFERETLGIFQEKVVIFTCLNGHLDDNMNIVLQKKANQLLNEFQARSVEHVVEPNFVSISAFTDEWEEYIMTSKHKMNLQIALRSAGMGGKHTVTVGTPIVTTEY